MQADGPERLAGMGGGLGGCAWPSRSPPPPPPRPPPPCGHLCSGTGGPFLCPWLGRSGRAWLGLAACSPASPRSAAASQPTLLQSSALCNSAAILVPPPGLLGVGGLLIVCFAAALGAASAPSLCIALLLLLLLTCSSISLLPRPRLCLAAPPVPAS